ncbi:MAG: ribosome recycling factor [Legionellaceae bacterium]|nr:ribosome recycling factor [Legionellaceae bacterium]
MSNAIKLDAEKRMHKTLETLQHDLAKVRTGRASAGFLDHVQVDYYGVPTALSQVANITAADARTLVVMPWEKQMAALIEKAIMTADLGLNPMRSGDSIRVPMPALNEERRKELARIVRHEAEQARVSIRNIRRDANGQLKDKVKAKEISEDEERRATEVVQKLTDKFIAQVEVMVSTKEKELMEV